MQISSYRLDRRDAFFEASLCEAPQGLPRRRCFVSEDWRDSTWLCHAIEWLKQRLRGEAQFVPVVHGRDPRARTTTAARRAGRRAEGPC